MLPERLAPLQPHITQLLQSLLKSHFALKMWFD